MNELIKYEALLPGLERAPDLDIELNYLGFGMHPSRCNVKIWLFGKTEQKAFILFTDLGIGTSVTNAAEELIESVYFSYLLALQKEDCIFAETYQGKKEAVDIVSPVWHKEKVVDVNWLHVGTFTK